MPRGSPRSYSTDRECWRAVASRDPAADGRFFYSVRTTGVYCRPVCPSRVPRKENVRFHVSCGEAERAGFRPCKRCRPKEPTLTQRRAAAVATACRLIERSDPLPTLGELAEAAGLSRFHFHRVFKEQTGVTPKAYSVAHRAGRVRRALNGATTITEAIYRAGFSSSSRFYANATKVLGMTPKTFQSGGQGMTIRFATSRCWLGAILVAATEQGICAILLGDDPQKLARDVTRRFPRARIAPGDAAFRRLVANVVRHVESPQKGCALPLDIHGTAFQQQVWQALTEIPPGTTTSYGQIARRVGRPRSVRAVGQAIAANPLAVVIPCHRVVRSDGSLSGYRWGTRRKTKLQQRERRSVEVPRRGAP